MKSMEYIFSADATAPHGRSVVVHRDARALKDRTSLNRRRNEESDDPVNAAIASRNRLPGF
jgi:hypothetical protein